MIKCRAKAFPQGSHGCHESSHMELSTYCFSETSEETIDLLGIGTNSKIAYVNSEYVLAIRKLLMNMKVNQ